MSEKEKGIQSTQRARAKDTDDMMFGERAECWYMRAVSGQLCLERIIGLLLLELIPAGQVLIKQIQL